MTASGCLFALPSFIKHTFHYRRYFPVAFRSDFEARVAKNLEVRKVNFDYEKKKIKYKWPEREATYTPDFTFKHNGLIVECKGYFKPQDRKKVEVLIQNGVRFKMLFQRASNPIRKGSKTTYGMWATKLGIEWAEGFSVPDQWLNETKCETETMRT